MEQESYSHLIWWSSIEREQEHWTLNKEKSNRDQNEKEQKLGKTEHTKCILYGNTMMCLYMCTVVALCNCKQIERCEGRNKTMKWKEVKRRKMIWFDSFVVKECGMQEEAICWKPFSNQCLTDSSTVSACNVHSYTSVHNFCIVMQYIFLQCFYCVLSASFYCNLYHLPAVLFLRFPILWPGWVFHIPIFHSWYNHNHFSRLLSLFFYICALCTVHCACISLWLKELE